MMCSRFSAHRGLLSRRQDLWHRARVHGRLDALAIICNTAQLRSANRDVVGISARARAFERQDDRTDKGRTRWQDDRVAKRCRLERRLQIIAGLESDHSRSRYWRSVALVAANKCERGRN